MELRQRRECIGNLLCHPASPEMDPESIHRGTFSASLGLHIETMEPGLCRGSFEFKPEHRNPYGVLHGGVLFTAIDTAMGGALFAALAPGETCACVESKTNFLAPVRAGRVSVEARVVSRGKRFATLEARAADASGKPVAVALGTFAIHDAKG
jgi:acyl-CoA thioesterase